MGQIWTHFDTYHNFLIQLCGEKKVFLAEPACASILKLQTDSDKPDIANPFCDLEDLSEKAGEKGLVLKTVILKPGDVLYIPSHWFHATDAENKPEKYSISVNIFFKENLENYHAPKDLYGNKPPLPALEIEKLTSKIQTLLSDIPSNQVRQFYLEKAIKTLQHSTHF